MTRKRERKELLGGRAGIRTGDAWWDEREKRERKRKRIRERDRRRERESWPLAAFSLS